MISKSPLQVQAYDYLKDMILSGKLDPDVLYSETRMSAEIGISRTPMREAIQCLSQDGYITVVPSKGFMLRQLNEKDMEESIQIRCAIEGFCVHLAAAEIDTKKGQKLLRDLEKLLQKQEKALSSRNGPTRDNIINGTWNKNLLNQFMEYDHQFHRALIDYVGNREFCQTFQRLMYLIHLTTAGALAVPGRTEDTLKEHKLFYSCLENGDGDAAYKLMLVHLMTPLAMHLTGEGQPHPAGEEKADPPEAAHPTGDGSGQEASETVHPNEDGSRQETSKAAHPIEDGSGQKASGAEKPAGNEQKTSEAARLTGTLPADLADSV